MILLVLLLVFLGVNLLAWRWGADTRDGRDWASRPSRVHISSSGRG
jgi:hypothetical protein